MAPVDYSNIFWRNNTPQIKIKFPRKLSSDYFDRQKDMQDLWASHVPIASSVFAWIEHHLPINNGRDVMMILSYTPTQEGVLEAHTGIDSFESLMMGVDTLLLHTELRRTSAEGQRFSRDIAPGFTPEKMMRTGPTAKANEAVIFGVPVTPRTIAVRMAAWDDGVQDVLRVLHQAYPHETVDAFRAGGYPEKGPLSPLVIVKSSKSIDLIRMNSYYGNICGQRVSWKKNRSFAERQAGRGLADSIAPKHRTIAEWEQMREMDKHIFDDEVVDRCTVGYKKRLAFMAGDHGRRQDEDLEYFEKKYMNMAFLSKTEEAVALTMMAR